MGDKTPIDSMLDAVAWRETGQVASDDGTPYATHEGYLRIVGDMGLRCYRLNTGQRIFNADDIHDLFGQQP